MHVTLKNLGILDYAHFELGDLTLVCGKNNTGKTYATYALFGFLDYLAHGNINMRSTSKLVTDRDIATLLEFGEATIVIKECKLILQELESICSTFKKTSLSQVFALPGDSFSDADFKISIQEIESALSNALRNESHKSEVTVNNKLMLSVTSTRTNGAILVRLNRAKEQPSPDRLKSLVDMFVFQTCIRAIMPSVFIASAERTGAAIFQKDLDLNRNRLVELLKRDGKKINPFDLLETSTGDYPLPVRCNIDCTRAWATHVKKKSFIAEKHLDILTDFADIIGGDYCVKNGELQFIPANPKKTRLPLIACSSAVRSMLDVGLYLRHLAKPGDLLMIDEPELNLHPENQRRVARLFSRLINIGIKVYITTHSDYIVRELNLLIMMKTRQQESHIKEIMQREGYKTDELLDFKRVRGYIAKRDKILIPGNRRKTECNTFAPMDITAESGLYVEAFDDTLDQMNRAHDDIIWGE